MNPSYNPPRYDSAGHSPAGYQPWLHRYAVTLAACTLLLVVAGASVTSKQAGLSVPDWPLSYGQVMPEMTGGVLFEHGHRLIATFVGMLTVGLAIWIAIAERRAWMKKLGWAALGAVIVQGLLGGLTVKLLLPPVVSVAHACLAQLFFSTTVAMAIFTSRRWLEGPEVVQDYGTPSLRSLAILLPSLVLAQVALGAAFRHGAMTIMAHVIGAMVVAPAALIVAAFVLHQFPEHRALHRAATVLLYVTLAQVVLGLGAYVARSNAGSSPLAMVIVTVAHVATGALTLASSIALAIQIRRNVTEQVREAVTA